MPAKSIEIQNIFGEPDSLAKEIAGMWVRWKADRSIWEKGYREVKEFVYATSTRETENGDNWSHSTVKPKLTSIYDMLKANYLDGLMPHDDWLNIQSLRELEVERKNKILAFLKTKHRLRNLRGIVDDLVDDWILAGNCFAGVSYIKETHINPLTKAQELGYQGPEVVRISPLDIVFDITAANFVETPKVVRTVMTLGEVAREIEENPGVRYDPDVLSEILSRRGALRSYKNEDIDKAHQAKLDGFGSWSQYIKGDQVEFLHFYGDIWDRETQQLYKNYVITVADRDRVARKEELNTWTGRPYIFHSAWRSRSDNLMGQGPLDNLIGMQYKINHLENARADAFDDMVYGDLVYRGDVEVKTGDNNSTEYWTTENGDVRRLAPDTAIFQADFQIDKTEQDMEEYAGAPREAAGFRTPGEKTKHEVMQLQTAASRVFQHKMTKFEIDILEQVVNAEIELSVLNLSGRDAIVIEDADRGTTEPMEITKDDLYFNGRVIPIGARHFARQAQLAGDLLQFQQAIQTDPALAQHFPSKTLAQTWQRVMGMEAFRLYQPYGRIPEQMEEQRRLQVAQQTIAEEQEAGLAELDEVGADNERA